MYLGDTQTLTHTLAGSGAGFDILNPTITIYDASRTAVVSAAPCDVSSADGISQTLSYAFTPGAAGVFFAVFRVILAGSIYQYEQTIVVERPGLRTVREYLRTLLEDTDASAYYFTDDELDGWLEAERRTLTPWAPGAPRSAAGGWPYGGWPTNPAGALPSPGATLTAGPGFTRYQAQPALRFWADDPAPVVYVDGQIAASDTYQIDSLQGAVTFVQAQSDSALVAVHADYFNVYEAAYIGLNVAMGQWASVAEIQTPAMRMKRAALKDALGRVEQLRRKGKVQRVPRRPAPMY